MQLTGEGANRETSVAGSIPRRHDLDALRAVAMLLGIVLHAGLSFTTVGWVVQDIRTNDLFDVAFMVIHGFRMPLFFMISGFFTAMLWRKRGLGRLIEHRVKRIFVPLMVGLVTIIPITSGIGILAFLTAGGASWVELVRDGDLGAVQALVTSGELEVNEMDPASKMSPLMWASLTDHSEMVAWLCENGAEVNQRNHENTTPLHNAAFLGRVSNVQILLEHGADPEIRRTDNSRPVESAQAPWEITQWILGFIQIQDIEQEPLMENRELVIRLLEGHEKGAAAPWQKGEALVKEGFNMERFMAFLTGGSFWHHLWFLAFLCWYVLLFAGYAAVFDAAKIKRVAGCLVQAPLAWCWFLPLTLLPQLFMEQGAFGPDTAAGFLPKGHMLVYYAVFFFFGALYFDSPDEKGRLGRWWWLTLPLCLLVVFPLGIDFKYGAFGWRESLLPQAQWGLADAVLQVIFTWGMVFGSIGFFRRWFSRESKRMRYISDSSYWLYLAHLPLVMLGQIAVRRWDAPALLKFVLITVLVSVFLLWTYEKLIRYSFVGTMLNGKKVRNAPRS